jgi:glycosyltransferase involved in cell wall biosynthesis
MRICLIGPSYPFRGGISHHTTLLCRYLRINHRVQFISFRRQYPRWLFPGTTDTDPSSMPLQEENTERLIDSLNPATWLQVACRIAKSQPNLLIIPWWVSFWAPQFCTIALLTKIFTKTEVVFLCHNVIEHESSPWKRFATKLTFLLADRFITHSKQETDKLRQLLGENTKVTTAFHPTYADLASGSISKESAKGRLGLSGSVLLFFGFVREYKGLSTLLKALPDVTKQKDVTLLVVGEFWKDKRTYLDMIQDLGISQAVMIKDGYVANEEIGHYFAAADLVVQPYLSVSGSGVCQLAYGFGRPVIATDIGSLSEVIEDRVNGRIVPPGDPAALAEAIVESLQPDILELYTVNAAKVTDKFSWQEFIDIIVGSSRRGNTK